MKNDGEKFGIVMATMLEAAPFIDGLNLTQEERNPFNLFKNNKIFLIISGIGKTNSALAASHLIHKYKLELLFNLGAAGALDKTHNLFDIVQVNKIIEFDRIDMKNGGKMEFIPDIFINFQNATLATQDRPTMAGDASGTLTKRATSRAARRISSRSG